MLWAFSSCSEQARCTSFSLQWPLSLWSMGSKAQASTVVAHALSCSTVYTFTPLSLCFFNHKLGQITEAPGPWDLGTCGRSGELRQDGLQADASDVSDAGRGCGRRDAAGEAGFQLSLPRDKPCDPGQVSLHVSASVSFFYYSAH